MANTVDILANNTFEDPSRRAPLITGGLDNDGRVKPGHGDYLSRAESHQYAS